MILAVTTVAQDYTVFAEIGLAIAILAVVLGAVFGVRRRLSLNKSEEKRTLITMNDGVCIPPKSGNPGIPFRGTLRHTEIVNIREVATGEES